MDSTDAAILISDCEARESRLSDWEAGFIDSIKAQLTDGRGLTDRQAATLEKIWDKATEKGWPCKPPTKTNSTPAANRGASWGSSSLS